MTGRPRPVIDGPADLWNSRAVVRTEPGGDRTSEVLTLTRALADPTRLRLFLALCETERCVTDLVASEGFPQPLVSHHLRVLTQAGLVQARRADGFTMYAVSLAGMSAARAVAMELLDPDAVGPQARPGGNEDCCR